MQIYAKYVDMKFICKICISHFADGCSVRLRPGMPLNSPGPSQAVKLTLLGRDVGFICPFVVIDPTDLGATTAVASARESGLKLLQD